jgi:hypothetical protein
LKLTCPGALVPLFTSPGAQRRKDETNKPGCDNAVKRIAQDLMNLKLTCQGRIEPLHLMRIKDNSHPAPYGIEKLILVHCC